MDTVEGLLNEKGRDVVSVAPDLSVLDLARLLNERRIGAVVVLEGGALVGIVTERDILNKVVAAARDPVRTTVRDVMSTNLVVVAPKTPVREAMAIMTESRHRHLPVLCGQELCGIISIGDCNRYNSRGQEFTLRYLEEYIRGEYR